MSRRNVAAPACCRFPTVLGPCGIAWSQEGIVRVVLPGDPVVESWADTPPSAPAFVTRAIEGIRDQLAGRPADLSSVVIDLSGRAPFTRRVLAAARSIGHGETSTYGALAAREGRPGAARAVGQVMARNPVPLLVPCHRVLGANGAFGGFSAAGGVETKRRLLALEAAARNR